MVRPACWTACPTPAAGAGDRHRSCQPGPRIGPSRAWSDWPSPTSCASFPRRARWLWPSMTCNGPMRRAQQALAFAARRLRAEPVGFVLARRTGPGETAETGRTDLVSTAVERPERMDVGSTVRGSAGPARPRAAGRGPSPTAAGSPSRGLLWQPVPGPRESADRSRLERWSRRWGSPSRSHRRLEPVVRDHLAALSRDARRSVVIVAMSPAPSVALVERIIGDGGGGGSRRGV